jgi:hypothetical protein
MAGRCWRRGSRAPDCPEFLWHFASRNQRTYLYRQRLLIGSTSGVTIDDLSFRIFPNSFISLVANHGYRKWSQAYFGDSTAVDLSRLSHA